MAICFVCVFDARLEEAGDCAPVNSMLTSEEDADKLSIINHMQVEGGASRFGGGRLG